MLLRPPLLSPPPAPPGLTPQSLSFGHFFPLGPCCTVVRLTLSRTPPHGAPSQPPDFLRGSVDQWPVVVNTALGGSGVSYDSDQFYSDHQDINSSQNHITSGPEKILKYLQINKSVKRKNTLVATDVYTPVTAETPLSYLWDGWASRLRLKTSQARKSKLALRLNISACPLLMSPLKPVALLISSFKQGWPS